MRRLAIAMSAELEPNTHLEIAHVLCTDIVGYSKLPLNQIVRGTEQFRARGRGGKTGSPADRRWNGARFFHQSRRAGALRSGDCEGVAERTGAAVAHGGWRAGPSIKFPM